MALVKFLNIFTLVSLAILHASFDACPVNALSVERGHLGRDLGRVHAGIAKKRGDSSSKKCRPRPSSVSQNPAVAPTPTHANIAPASNTSQPAHTSSSSQPASTNAPASSVNSKIMFGWSNNEQPSLIHFGTGSRRLVYNWKLDKYTDFDIDTLGNFEFVPTAHSIDDIYRIPSVLKAGYAKYAKFINEPDIASQGNMSPQEAYQLWNQYFKPLVGLGYSLIAPSVTGGGGHWLQTFLGLCGGECDIYALDLHFYGITVEDFQTSVNTFHGFLPEVPLWLTEVGCHDYSGKNQPCTAGVFNAFFSGVMNYVESTEFIGQIAWFGWFTAAEIPMGLETVNCMLVCPSGDNKQCQPNSLGSQYINYH